MVNHILKGKLIPEQKELEFLFVGTFNPKIDDNQAEYFYERETNYFWCILPHAFDEHCLIDKDPDEWIKFCGSKNIGITDLIESLEIAEQQDFDALKSYSDIELEKFKLNFITDKILEVISTNRKTLKGVFFTRSSNQQINKIWGEWKKIVLHCDKLNKENELKIQCTPLLSPSLQGNTIRQTIEKWKTAIRESSMPSAS